jgi:hypothetical protein
MPNTSHYDQSADDKQFLREHGDELSRSTQRAKWISAPGEHEDHPGQTLATRSHDVIKHWAEERKAVPATVPGTERGDRADRADRAGVLRFNSPSFGGDNLREINWAGSSRRSTSAIWCSFSRSTRRPATRATSSASTIRAARTPSWPTADGASRQLG